MIDTDVIMTDRCNLMESREVMNRGLSASYTIIQMILTMNELN